MNHNVQSQSQMMEFLMLLLPGPVMVLSVPLTVKSEVELIIVVAMKTEWGSEALHWRAVRVGDGRKGFMSLLETSSGPPGYLDILLIYTVLWGETFHFLTIRVVTYKGVNMPTVTEPWCFLFASWFYFFTLLVIFFYHHHHDLPELDSNLFAQIWWNFISSVFIHHFKALL